jgi:predicted HD phosphohydrolase
MSTESLPRTVAFTQMKDGTREDYLLLREREKPFVAMTADRVLRELRLQEDETLTGYRITRLGHALQTTTRAWRDGADIDWVAAALLHDIGDGLAPQNHDETAAAILRPYLREQVVWAVQHHGAFQMVYYAQHYGWDPNARERHKGNPYYDDCAEFCERWDQASFDPDYRPEPLDFFEPLVREVFARRAFAPEVVRPGVRLPLLDEATALRRAAAAA